MLRTTPDCADLERAAVLLGCAFAPAEPVDEALRTVGTWLDMLADGCPADMAGLLAHVIGRHELRGATTNYYDPGNSMLHRIAATGCGMPISLSLVVRLVGRRVGVDLDLIGLPGHVMVRSGDRWADPFSGPGVMSTRDALDRWAQVTGRHSGQLRGQDVQSMTPRQIVVRMLNNLTTEFARRDDRFSLSTAVRLRQTFDEFAGEQAQWAAWQSSWN